MIEYTQTSVAWPQLDPDPTQKWVVDHLGVSYSDEDGRSGEFSIDFMRFDRELGDTLHAQVQVFHDGLDLFYDERIQRVMAAWHKEDDDANVTPADFIRWLEAEGAVPSSYHKAGTERPDEETARLRAMRGR